MGVYTKTGGRAATEGVIPGLYGLSVGNPGTEPPRGWKWVPLLKVARLETGHTPSRRHPEYWDGDIPWIGIKDASEHHGRSIDDTRQHTNALGIENSAARLLPENTVCLSRTASIGYITRMARPMTTSQDFVNWICGPSIESRYLMYILLAEVDSLFRFAHGTTHQTIYFPEVKAFHVCLPPLDEQRRIAGVLGALDDKIELNRKMNQTLEEMAQAIFKSWFIDFDGHDDLVESELGLIPRGWEVKPLSEISSLTTHTVKPRVQPEVIWEHYSIPSFDQNKTPLYEKGSSIKSNKYLVPVNSVLVSKLNPRIPRIWMPEVRNEEFAICSTEFMPFEPTNSGRCFLYCFFQSSTAKNALLSRVTGTTGSRQRVRPADIAVMPIVLAPRLLMDLFERASKPLLQKAMFNNYQSRTLAELRYTLLPKLISGEIRVPEAEEEVEGVL